MSAADSRVITASGCNKWSQYLEFMFKPMTMRYSRKASKKHLKRSQLKMNVAAYSTMVKSEQTTTLNRHPF